MLALLQHHGLEQPQTDGGVLPGHDHVLALDLDDGGTVPGLGVHDQLLLVHNRLLAAALVLGHEVDLALGVIALLDGPGLGRDHAPPDLVALEAADEQAHLVAGVGLLEDLVEHLDAGDLGLDALVVAEDLELGAGLQLAALGSSGDDRSSEKRKKTSH